MADFNNGYPDVITLNGRELLLLVDPLFSSGLNITVENFVEQYGVNEISDVPGLVDDLAAKQTEINANITKLATIEEGADVTDQANVFSALSISSAGSRDKYLSEQGTYEIAGSGTGDVTKAAVDAAIGAFATGDSAQFYNEQGNFIDAVYDSIENAPIIRNATVETITIAGTRTNVQVPASGTSEFSTITMQDTFNPVPTQYTSIFTSPNTSFTPALVLPTGSQGRQLSLTELDGTVHRFAYTTNGNYRLLAGGLSGTVRLGAVAVATTASVTAAVSVPDQTAGQTITLTGDQTGIFSVGDFISPLNNNFGAYRGIFIESVTLNGGNTDIVGTSNGAATFQTTSTLYLAGPADTVQGTASSFSYDPDTADAVYSSAVVTEAFTNTGTGITAHLTQIANSIAALETAITWSGEVTDNGDGTSSVLIDLGTETNIDSSFTITGGLNNMNTLANTDGAPGVGLTVATTVTVIDPEATEVASQTFGVSNVNDNNVDTVGNFINTAVNNNTETPIDFTSEYGSGVVTLTAQEAGNTNPWTIVINNNGATAANAGNLSTSSVQTGEQINQMDILTVDGSIKVDTLESLTNEGTYIQLGSNLDFMTLRVNGDPFIDLVNLGLLSTSVVFNNGDEDIDFRISKAGAGTGDCYNYDAGTDVTTINSDTINFVANTITGLPSGTSTTVLGTTGEIDVSTVDTTATVSLSSTITDEITANTGKTGITTAQTNAITANTSKTGITTVQASAITTNTAKTSFPGFGTTATTALQGDTNETGTWTPSLSNVGTVSNTIAHYTRTGDSVTLTGEIVLAAGTSTSAIVLNQSSLPFDPVLYSNYSPVVGTWATAPTLFGTIPNVSSATESGVVVFSTGNPRFLKSDSSPLVGTEINQWIGFSITYQIP